MKALVTHLLESHESEPCGPCEPCEHYEHCEHCEEDVNVVIFLISVPTLEGFSY
jgi:hypothetical protein